MTHSDRACLRALVLTAAAGLALSACGAATPGDTSEIEAGCHGRAPGVLDFRVGGRGTLLPPAPACPPPAAVALAARGGG